MIFIDRSIPKGVATALMAVRPDVMWLEPHFPQDTKDTEWLRVAGANGWLVVSRDKNIRRRPGERQSIIENNVGCFYLTQKQHSTRWEYLKLLCQTLDEMERLFRDTPRPFIFGVDRSGQFRPVYPPVGG
jgi:predicted nuclease of predicted toxin-antitoxin system